MTRKHFIALTALVAAVTSCKHDQQNDLIPTPITSSIQQENITDMAISTRTIRTEAQLTAIVTTQQQEILNLINQKRSTGCNCGSKFYPKVAPLKLDDRLNTAATLHAKDMATKNYFSHTGSDGSQPWDRIKRQGYSYSYAGENIGAGYTTASAMVQAWIKSPGHCANIMSPNFTNLGVGYSTGGSYRYYWVADFAKPR